MADKRLLAFVQEALRAGHNRTQIQTALTEAGWPPDQVSSALDSFAEVDFPLPVPRPEAQLSARDAALYLVMFGMLYVSAWQFGSLLFQFINLALPDPMLSDAAGMIGSQIRFSTASLLVAFPLYLFLTMRIQRTVDADPVQRTSGVRKWLTYLTLALAACIIAGDLVSLLYGLLSGELTTRFILKALVVGAVSGFIFGYYLRSLRADDEATSP
jgi:hypothetical protein